MQTQTHDLTFTDVEVRKRYVRYDRGFDRNPPGTTETQATRVLSLLD